MRTLAIGDIHGCSRALDVLLEVEGDYTKTVLDLPPRYRTHEHEVAGIYNLLEVQDIGVLKGSKAEQKVYRRHSLYPGGLREISAREMLAKRPERIISLAVKGMLPKTKLGRAMAKKLKVYADADHPHAAQRPQVHQPSYRSNLTVKMQSE